MNGTPLLPVAPEKVDAVLLADGWHKVALGSFTVGALGFGDSADRGVPGYRFEEISNGSLHHSATLAGPLGAVLAVRQVTSRRVLQEDSTGQKWSSHGHDGASVLPVAADEPQVGTLKTLLPLVREDRHGQRRPPSGPCLALRQGISLK